MANRTGTYSAFYVDTPFNPSALGAHATEDFRYYNLLNAWKASDSSFPFVDSHNKTYNVRDGSDWETTLKPRLRARLRVSKKIVLFLSPITLNSRALREEIDYGINNQGLPVIVVYPDCSTNSDIATSTGLKQSIRERWSCLPIFRASMDSVPTLRVALKKDRIRAALADPDFAVATKTKPGTYWYKP